MSSLAIDWQGEYVPYDGLERLLPELKRRGVSLNVLGQTIFANHNAGRFRVRVAGRTAAAGSTIRLTVEGIASLAPLAILSGRLDSDPLKLFGKVVVTHEETLDAMAHIPLDAESGTYVFLAQQWEPGGQPAYTGGSLIYASSAASVKVKTRVDAPDETGERQSVILDIEEYERLLEALEDLEDLRAADQLLGEIERGEGGLLPYPEAVEEMEKERRRLREAGELPGDPKE